MTTNLQLSFIYFGAFCAIGFSAIGSVLGCGTAAASAIGSWKKCYAQGKDAPFQLSILTGVPMSQTIYGLILMLTISGSASVEAAPYWPAYLIIGLLGGIGIGLSAWYQGKAAADACDAFTETRQGFVNYLIALGIVETIAIFIMVFSILIISKTATVA